MSLLIGANKGTVETTADTLAVNILKIEKPDEANRDWSNKFTTDTPIESIKARIDADAEWIRQERQRPDYTGSLESLFSRWEEMVSKYATMQAQHQNDIMNSVAKSQLKRAELKSQIIPSQATTTKSSGEVLSPKGVVSEENKLIVKDKVNTFSTQLAEKTKRLADGNFSIANWKMEFDDALDFSRNQSESLKQLTVNSFLNILSSQGYFFMFSGENDFTIQYKGKGDAEQQKDSITSLHEYFRAKFTIQDISPEHIKRALLLNSSERDTFLKAQFNEKGELVGDANVSQYVEMVLFKKYNLTNETLRDRLTTRDSGILFPDQMLLWAYLNGAYKNMTEVKEFVKGYNQDVKQAQSVVDSIFPLGKQVELAKTFHMRPPESGNSLAGGEFLLFLAALIIGMGLGGWKGFALTLGAGIGYLGLKNTEFGRNFMKRFKEGKEGTTSEGNENVPPREFFHLLDVKSIPSNVKSFTDGFIANNRSKIDSDKKDGEQLSQIYSHLIRSENFRRFSLEDINKALEGKDDLTVASLFGLDFLVSDDGKKVTGQEFLEKYGKENVEYLLTLLISAKSSAKNLDELLGMKYEAPKQVTRDDKQATSNSDNTLLQGAKDAVAPVTAAVGNGVAAMQSRMSDLVGGKEGNDTQAVRTVASFRDGRYYIIGSHGKPVPMEYKDFPQNVQKAIERYKDTSEKSKDYLLLLQAFASGDMSEDWNKKLDTFIQSVDSGKVKQEELIASLQSLIKETGSKDAPKLIEFIETGKKQELYLYIKNELDGYTLVSDRLIDGFIQKNNMHAKLQSTFQSWKGSAWDESKISNDILSSKAKERLKDKREEVAKLSVTTYAAQFGVAADAMIQSGDKRTKDVIVEKMQKDFIERSNLLALKYEYIYDEVKNGKIPESQELELFKDIEGIGWNHVADKNADWWKFGCEMVAIEVVAIAAGAFTGSAGFWAVNAARASRIGKLTSLIGRGVEVTGGVSRTARIASVAGKGVGFIGTSVIEGTAFYAGYGAAKGQIEQGNWKEGYSMQGWLESMAFAAAFKGLNGIYSKLGKAEGNFAEKLLLKEPTRIVLDTAAFGIVGGGLNVTLNGGEWTSEQIFQGFVLALLNAAMRKSTVSRTSKGTTPEPVPETAIQKGRNGEVELVEKVAPVKPKETPTTPKESSGPNVLNKAFDKIKGMKTLEAMGMTGERYYKNKLGNFVAGMTIQDFGQATVSAWKQSHGFSQTTGALLRGMAKDIVWNRRGTTAVGMTLMEAFFRNPDQMDFSDPIQNLIICTLFGPFKGFFLDRLDSMERMTNIPAKAITEADISGFFGEYAGKINTYLTNHYNSKK